MKIIFFSDAHLGKGDGDGTRVLHRFMGEVCARADEVCILGDIFEFYHGFGEYVYPWYRWVIEAIRDLTRKGVRVHFIEGNHEFGMGRYFTDYTGASCHHHAVLHADGLTIFVSHGYEFGSPGLTRLFKSRPARGLMDLLGPGLSWRMAMLLHLILSRRKKGRNPRIMERFRGYGRAKLLEGYDAAVFAHSHMADMEEVPAGGTTRWYLNTGDLMESGTYGEYETGRGFSIRKFPHPANQPEPA